jgi:hypothetical protein
MIDLTAFLFKYWAQFRYVSLFLFVNSYDMTWNEIIQSLIFDTLSQLLNN